MSLCCVERPHRLCTYVRRCWERCTYLHLRCQSLGLSASLHPCVLKVGFLTPQFDGRGISPIKRWGAGVAVWVADCRYAQSCCQICSLFVSSIPHLLMDGMAVLVLGGTEKVLMDLDMCTHPTWHSVPNWWVCGKIDGTGAILAFLQ